MERMNVLLDTNILIDYLIGYKEAAKLIEQYESASISIITKMEILVGTEPDNKAIICDFLKRCHIVYLNDEIADIAIELRRNNKIKLPDAIIWASAKCNNMALLTK
jgi:predicted nucleic acid-binding protein